MRNSEEHLPTPQLISWPRPWRAINRPPRCLVLAYTAWGSSSYGIIGTYIVIYKLGTLDSTSVHTGSHSFFFSPQRLAYTPRFQRVNRHGWWSRRNWWWRRNVFAAMGNYHVGLRRFVDFYSDSIDQSLISSEPYRLWRNFIRVR